MTLRLTAEPLEPLELTYHELLDRSPGEVAAVFRGSALRYDELRERSRAFAGGLVELGVKPGDRVALLMSNRPEFLVVMAGVSRTGAILVPLNTRSSPTELGKVLAHSGASVAVAEESFRDIAFVEALRGLEERLPALRRIVPLAELDAVGGAGSGAQLPAVRASDPAVLIYTSGTTGEPKGCLHGHRAYVTNAGMNARFKGLGVEDRIISSVPFFNIFGLLNCILEAYYSGATIAVLPTFETTQALELVERERVSCFLGTPTMWIRLEEHPDFPRRDTSSLRTGSIGGAPIPPELLARWRERGCELAVIYGMSEAPTIMLNGRPTPGLEIELREGGELYTRGYNHLLGYYLNETATAERIQDGWLRTGDLAEVGDDERVRVVGRADDMVIVGGFNVQPGEVEQVLRWHPDVADAAAFGIPERELGEVLAAWIVPRQGALPDQAELQAHCREHLARYKVPRHFRIVPEFPLTANGKVQRFRMREETQRELGAAPAG